MESSSRAPYFGLIQQALTRDDPTRRREDHDLVRIDGPGDLLASAYDVTEFAAATVAAAALTTAQLHAVRRAEPCRRVLVDRPAAVAAFLSERLFASIGWDREPAWDPIAGNYRTQDGWIRLHTNYSYHRAAVERVLGQGDRAAVAARTATWNGADLEAAVVGERGCAAAMHSTQVWSASRPGAAAATEPFLRTTWSSESGNDTRLPPVEGRSDAGPFAGIRVLDLTRVIAGPVCTRFLAGYGADVLRIDPPGFQEVAALVPDMMAGKRAAALDLTDADGRRVFEGLVAEAHVLVGGLRPDALARLGYDTASLRRLNPSIITASLNAYGWDGPWRDRRGFDSLVQMSCGLAATGAGNGEPVALPAQALDHGTGYLLAAGIAQALADLVATGRPSDVRASLIGTANLLMTGGPRDIMTDTSPALVTERVRMDTAWGPAEIVAVPGRIEGVAPRWTIAPGPLGSHDATWSA